jgi:hypothetical protein
MEVTEQLTKDGSKISGHIYRDGEHFKTFTVAYISSNPTIADCWRKITTSEGEDHKLRKFDGYAFMKLFIDSCPAGGIDTIRLKLDDTHLGIRRIYLIPVEDIVRLSEPIQHSGYERQLFLKEAYLLQYFTTELPLKQKA